MFTKYIKGANTLYNFFNTLYINSKLVLVMIYYTRPYKQQYSTEKDLQHTHTFVYFNTELRNLDIVLYPFGNRALYDASLINYYKILVICIKNTI